MMSLKIPEGDFDAVLFDCDGTLVDSMPLHYEAWCAGIEAAGSPFPFSTDTFYGHAGIKEATIIEKLSAEYRVEADVETIVRVKAEVFDERFETLQPIAPVVAYAEAYHGKRPFGVVSGSGTEHVRRSLEVAGIDHLFDLIVSPEDVAPGRGKPHPDMFVLAAGKLGVHPSACLVFEDGQSGIDAATAAGMPHVFVPTPAP